MAYDRPSRRRRGDGVGVVASLPAADRGTREASMSPKMPARAAGRSEASRDTSPAVRAWLRRGRRVPKPRTQPERVKGIR